ncbi:hypothetical protein ABFZ85_07670 [Hyphococcus formosus]|uniref:hypothetical protein n=1 Tax=Hyphococcus formosus TaxID=3143534 RepID=UPI00398B5ABD
MRDHLTRIAIIIGMVVIVFTLTKLMSPPEMDAEALAQESADPIAIMAETADAAINYAPAYAALNPYQTAMTQSANAQFDPSDDYWGLPRTPGHEETAAYCAACHTLQIVMQQQQTPEGWDYLLDWMVTKQGMAEPPADTRALIHDYLSREFGTDASPE